MSETEKKTETPHTPGPWATPDTGRAAGEVWDRQGNTLAYATNAYGDASRVANARLIAAAPDLLAALKGMVENHNYRFHPQAKLNSVCDGNFGHCRLAIAANAAIAKAEGR